MTPGDADRFCAALTALGEIFERELSDAAQTLWFDALADLDLDACLRAFEVAAKTKTFMPRPAEIRGIAAGLHADPELVAEAAWQTFRELAARVGGYQSTTVEDGALAGAVVATFGSWELACWTELTPEMWASKRKEFGRIYRLKREEGVTGPRRLVGYCDRTNYEQGFTHTAAPDPALPPGTRLALPPSREAWIDARAQREAEADVAHAALVECVQDGLAAALARRDAARGAKAPTSAEIAGGQP